MKYQKGNIKRNRWIWVGLNILPILTMLISLAFPTPVVQAQGTGISAKTLASSGNGVFLDNKKPQNCQPGEHCALHFNGINQWVEEDQFRGFDTASFSFETWINWSGDGKPIQEGNDLVNGIIPIISMGIDPNTSVSNVKMILGIVSESGLLYIGFHGQPSIADPTGQNYSLTSNTEVTSDTWHYIASTFDGQILRLYLDGNMDAEIDLGEPVQPDLVGANVVTLAAALPNVDKGMGFLKGSLDEVRIWEVARTQQELISNANQEGLSDPNLIGYWMMNEGKGSEIKDSRGNGKHGISQNDPTWTDGAPMLISAAPITESMPSIDAVPNNPTLVSPLDGSTGISTSPSLNVNVSDPDNNNLTVTFYGRAATASQPDFTFIIIPDTQKYTTPPPGNGIFQLQTQWIVSQKTVRNIAFVGHLGDTIDDWNVPEQWNTADAAMKNLENAGIPYGIGFGNTDEDHYGVPPDTTFINTYFPVSRFAGKSYYGGAYNNDNSNSYQLISASGLNFIIIDIKYNVSYNTSQGQAILAWANNLLQLYSNRRAIVITHNLLTTSNVFSTDGAMVYNALKGNPNLFLMMGGHLDTEGMRTDPGTDGHTIYSLRSDYQTRANGGNGWLRIMRFSPDNNKIYVTTYSTTLNQFETDADSQFSLDYNMGGSAYQVIGSTSVASGSTASVSWSGLTAQTQYQWYVTVNDGTSTTTGPTWNFTTGGGQSAPVITTQPVDLTVNAGQTATFSAAASGSPTPSVQWQVSTNGGTNWSNIPGATSASYSFTAQSSDTGKQFRAVFTNTYGSATTNAVTLTVNTVPVITTQPSPVTVNAGQSASFTAGASGTPAPSVKWQVSTNGTTWTDISGATSTTYTFTTTAVDNENQYRAVFTNIAGSATTNTALLTVYFAPSVTTQPTNQTVTAGQTASFFASASGNPAPTVQWQLSTDGSSWANISGATATTYSLTTSASDNGRQFRAVFTNSVASVNSNAALLTVNTGPVITQQPVNLTVNASQTATFTAAASGSPTPTVQWQLSTNGTNWTNINGATSTTYSFTATDFDNGKQYRAVFTNTAGSAITNAAILTVQTPPVVTTNPTNQVVNAGSTVTFTAAATGRPSPSVQWQVSPNGSTWGDINGATSTTLSFIAQGSDNGEQYRAVFTNAAGTATSSSAVLTVYIAPAITLQPQAQSVVAGNSVSFTAGASGNPTPTVQWQASLDGNTWNNITGATSITYTFVPAAGDNGKLYRAVFTNSVGSATTSAVVLTVYYAPTITTQPVDQSLVAGQTVTFIAVAGGNPIPTAQWQVSNDGTTWSNITGATSTTLSFTVQITDNGEKYRAVFTNLAGTTTTNAVLLTVGLNNIPPSITLNPSNVSVNAGQTASFTAAASGTPAPTVQWQGSSNGITWADISGATSLTYNFTALATDNGKQFRAVFTNTAGSATTTAALLTVYTTPVVTTQPVNSTVNENQTATFTSAATGNPTPSVQWQSSPDGSSWSNLNGATYTTLSFSAQAADNGKQYRAVFTNAAGSTISISAILTVNTAPVITVQPISQSIIDGNLASFTAAASGSPAPTVQWQVSTNGTTWTNISGATSTAYSFTVATGDNGKQYRAVFTNLAGSATTSAALLTVYTIPVVTTQPSNLTVNAGQTASFSAAATGNPTPSVQWQSSPDGSTWSDINGATSPTLSFTTQATDNGRQYRAAFTNAAGTAFSNAAILTVRSAPVITTQPVNQTVTSGQTATFTAAASGNPAPTIQWQSSTDGITWSNISGATSATYSFTAQVTDSGKRYHAIFTNVVGSATTSPVTLTVQFAPQVTLQPFSQTLTAGQVVTFSAAASGNPSPTVQWQLSINNGTSWTNISGATSSSYSFTTSAADNGSQYRAVFTNSIGSTTSNAAVLTVNFAPQVTTQPASQTVASGQTATFTALANGNPAPTVQWQVSLDGINWTNISGATTTSYSFATQASDNGKSFRAVFSNSIGTTNSNSALLTVQNDLIFKDDFNTCNASAWNGGVVNIARLTFNTASGRNSTCGMGVTISNSITAYVMDNSPLNETQFRGRLYFMQNTLQLPNNSPVIIYAGYTTSSKMVLMVQVRLMTPNFQVRAGTLSDTNTWSYTSWTNIPNSWHSFEFNWLASSSATANDGSLTFWVDGVQTGSINNWNNDAYSIDKVSLGAISGLTKKMSGAFFLEDYESRRLTYIGQ